MNNLADSEYADLLQDIKQEIELAQVKIAEAITKEEARLYKDIEQVYLAYQARKLFPITHFPSPIPRRATRRKWRNRRTENNLPQASLESIRENNLLKFLHEMGGVLGFIGSQVRLEVDSMEFFFDFLLFHRRLRCPVVLELKAGEFIPEYIGKLQFYLAVVNDTLRLPDENPAIGIILCKSRTKPLSNIRCANPRRQLASRNTRPFRRCRTS